MRENEPSRSAGIIAAHRAMEASRAPEKRICFDPFARAFMPKGFTVIGRHDIPEKKALDLFNQMVPGFHDYFLARTRYIDDHLKKMVDNGLEQLVILGAGYDSRAYRFQELKKGIRVFEVDNQATQSHKKKKVKAVFNTLPDHIRYVTVDFQGGGLEAGLVRSGYDADKKTLFIWEGVTMYIHSKAVDATLSFISENKGPGSGVIFDYTYPEVVAGTHDRKEAKEWYGLTRQSDEPLVFGIGNDQIEEFLSDRGFHRVVCITDEYFNANYFCGVNQGRGSTPILSIVHARINRTVRKG